MACCSLVACFSPSAPYGVPCDKLTKNCPGDQVCVLGADGYVCAPQGQTSASDAATGDRDAAAVSTDSGLSNDGGVVTCASGNLGSVLGTNVATGTTNGRPDSSHTCGGGGSPDVSYAWTAPSTATFTIDTCNGSQFDSVLTVLGGCGGVQLACNDDSCGVSSRVRVSLTQGQSIIIVVDGLADMGHYSLSIH
ncbi:MAG: hypothetical protein JWO36_879 [Myxococcales bacterium]|nr:hypothetical protein [Myxococcales bacterium]